MHKQTDVICITRVNVKFVKKTMYEMLNLPYEFALLNRLTTRISTAGLSFVSALANNKNKPLHRVMNLTMNCEICTHCGYQNLTSESKFQIL